MKYILSHLTLKKQIDLINLKGTLRQYTLWVLSHISSKSKQFQKSILILIPDNLTIFFQCIGWNKVGYVISDGTVELGDKERFGHPEIVP